jgi:MATE family multidrug resistance protein
LLVIAAIFQLFDGLQVVSAGALRGVGDVRIPAWYALAAYWLVAIPLGAWLAFYWKLDAAGIWTGLAAGLAVAAIGLALRAWWKLAPRPFLQKT